MKTYAIIVAAGSSTRMVGAVPKQFRELSGRPMLAETVSRFESASSIDQIVVVVSEEHLLYTSERVIEPYDFGKVLKIVVGGSTRFESVWNGIKSLPISTGMVAIHDGARPLVLPSDIDRVVATAVQERAAMLAAPVTDTVKRVQDGFILATLDRSLLHLAQTPQVFQYDLFKAACEGAIAEGNAESYTDDAALCEASGFKVKVVPPTGPNFKVSTNDDLELVRMIIRERDNG